VSSFLKYPALQVVQAVELEQEEQPFILLEQISQLVPMR